MERELSDALNGMCDDLGVARLDEVLANPDEHVFTPTEPPEDDDRERFIVTAFSRFICHEVGVSSSDLIDVQAQEMVDYLRNCGVTIQ